MFECTDSGEYLRSPMGDEREHRTPCFWCGSDRTGRSLGKTRNWNGVCDRHQEIEAATRALPLKAAR